jgi:3-hydroxyacyl-[acyl-carrier-protein] dehydratase
MRPLLRRDVLDSAGVRTLLPHRDPMVFVDRVVGLRTDTDPALLAELDLRADHPVFAAHFPGRPLWPGALVIEGLAQSAQLLLLLRAAAPVVGTGVLADISVRLLRPVAPGGTLLYRVDLTGTFGAGFRLAVEARVDRTRVAEGTLGVALLPGGPDESS